MVRRRKGGRTSAEYAATNRRQTSEVWQDTLTLLTDTISSFPVELIRMVGDFAKHSCIYWASYAPRVHIKFWQLSLDNPKAAPQLVGWQSLRKYEWGWLKFAADGYDGSFYLFLYNSTDKLAIFQFDANRQECTTVCDVHTVTAHGNIRYTRHVICGYNNKNDGAKLFYVFADNEFWLLSLNNTNNLTWTKGPDYDNNVYHNNVYFNWDSIMIGFLGGVVIVHYRNVIFYHPKLPKWIVLPSLQEDRVQLSVIGECLTTICHCQLSVLKLTWNDILHISDSQTIGDIRWQPCPPAQTFTCGSKKLIPNWIFHAGQYYLTDSSVVFCSQSTIDHKQYARIKDKPPHPKHITRLDLDSFTASWH
jgi:hypothetical protein